MLFSLVRKFSTKMVLIVRTDLNMSQGKIAAQCAHAAVSLYASALDSSSLCLKVWVHTGQPKIILKVNSEAELQDVYAKAKLKNLNTCFIYDAGKTEINSGTLTVVGLGPNYANKIDELTRNFKLL